MYSEIIKLFPSYYGMLLFLLSRYCYIIIDIFFFAIFLLLSGSNGGIAGGTWVFLCLRGRYISIFQHTKTFGNGLCTDLGNICKSPWVLP